MSTATLRATDRPTAPTATEVHRVTQGRVVVSEWIKFRSLRSSWITLASGVAGLVLFGALASYATNANFGKSTGPGPREAFSALGTSLGGITLAQLAIGVLGVLVITGEYSTGMIRASLSAVPTRLPMLWGKVIVFSAVTFVVSLVGVVVAFFVGQALLGTHATTIGASGVLRALVGAALYLTVVGILAMGLGGLLRSTAGGIACVVVLLLLAPGLGQLLPSSWQDHILPYLPSNAGGLVYSVTPDTGTLGTWSGFAVMCVWAVVAVGLAAVALKRRDA